MVLMADVADGREFCQRIQRAVFCRLRKIDHARCDHVVVVAIGIKCPDIGIDGSGRQFAVLVRDGQDLMAAEFNRTGFMHADMARVGRDDAFIRMQDGIDDRRIRLRAANQEKDIRRRCLTGFADFRTCRLREFIKAVACRLQHVRLHQFLQDGRMSAFQIVRSKRNPFIVHKNIHPLHVSRIVSLKMPLAFVTLSLYDDRQ